MKTKNTRKHRSVLTVRHMQAIITSRIREHYMLMLKMSQYERSELKHSVEHVNTMHAVLMQHVDGRDDVMLMLCQRLGIEVEMRSFADTGNVARH